MPGIALREDYNAAGLRTHARHASCPRENGGEKVGHSSGGIISLRAAE